MIEITYKYTAEVAKRNAATAIKENENKNTFVIIRAIGAIFILFVIVQIVFFDLMDAARGMRTNALFLLLAGLFLLFNDQYLKFMIFRKMKKLGFINAEVATEFYDDKIVSISQEVRSECPWSKMKKLIREKDGSIILHYGKNAPWIPKSAFKNEKQIDELIELAKTNSIPVEDRA